jgi:SAM-dependent methyltransferase
MSYFSPENESVSATLLHTLNPLGRFSDRATDYAKYRPSYPAIALDQILAGLPVPTELIAADIGAGTGISARLLAERGVRVKAVEPNAAMRQSAKPHSLVEWLDATAENTQLANASVHLVTCFQAFHWFDSELALPEFHRILSSTGRLALVWNDRDLKDPFTKEYTQLIRTIAQQHPASSRPPVPDALFISSYFQDIQHHRFTYQQSLDLTSLMGRCQSTSYIPKTPAVQQQLGASLQALYDRWADTSGLVHLMYRTKVFLASCQ